MDWTTSRLPPGLKIWILVGIRGCERERGDQVREKSKALVARMLVDRLVTSEGQPSEGAAVSVED